MTAQFTETEPLAELWIERTEDVLVLSGLVPGGIEPAEAARLVGGALPDGLAGGGAGDPAARRHWRRWAA